MESREKKHEKRPGRSRRVISWVAGIIASLLVVGVTAYAARDFLVLNAANYVLRDSGVRIDSATVGELGLRQLEFDRIYVDLGDNDALELMGLQLPVLGASADSSPIAIRQLIVVSGSNRPPTIAHGLLTFLGIAQEIPLLELSIEELVMAGYPKVRHVRLTVNDDSLTLRSQIDKYDVTIVSAPTTGGEHHVEVDVSDNQSVNVANLSAIVSRVPDGAHIAGKGRYHFPALVPILHRLDAVPPALRSLSGVFEANHRFAIPLDAEEPFSILAAAAPQTGLQLEYKVDASPPVLARSLALGTTTFAMNYPAMTWLVAIDETQFVVDWDDYRDVAVDLHSLRCESGIKCSFDAKAEIERLSTGQLEMADLLLGGPVEMQVEDSEIVIRSSAFEVAARTVSTGTVSLANPSMIFDTPTELSLFDDYWQFRSEAANAKLPEMTVGDNIALTTDSRLSQLYYRSMPEQGSLTVHLHGILTELSISGHSVRVPDIAAGVSLENGTIESGIDLRTTDDSLSGKVTLVMPTDGAPHELLVDSLNASFTQAPASSWLPGSSWPGDVVDGRLELGGRLSLNATGAANGSLQFAGSGLSGYYGDYVFSGFGVMGPLPFGDAVTLTGEEFVVQGDLLDVGIPITNLSSAFYADPGQQTVLFSSLGADLLGGRVDVAPFVYNNMQERVEIVVSLEAVQLGVLVDHANMQTLSATGAVSGQIPVSISDGKVSVDSGYISSDQTGGVVRYSSGDSALQDAVPDSQISTVTRALSNFVYESLSSSVSYSENGDLAAQMTLRGTNPDLDPHQPIILNLSLENNIPDFLRSMRASRSIEELLEQNLNR